MPHKRQWKPGDSTRGFSHFGQQVDTDICTGFEASWPHGFTITCMMINFCDRYGHETWVFFPISPSSHEVKSAGLAFHSQVESRLKDGKLGRWVTDNAMGE